MKKVAVIGAGTMGRSIARFFAQQNINVTIIESKASVLQSVQAELSQDIQHPITYLNTYPTFLDVDIVIEAVPEKLEIKQQVFKELEKCVQSSTILCTNTSGIPITEIAQPLQHPERLVGTHFFTPAAYIPLVEVIKGEKTSDEVAQKVYQFLKQSGKEPVLLNKEVPGFICNRIQHAIVREALSLLEEGVASVEDIDKAIKWSIGLRMVLSGPFEQRDINGIDIHYEIASYLYKSLNNSTEPSSILKEKVEQGELGIKTRKGFYDWRNVDLDQVMKEKNNRLKQLIQWLREENK